MGIVYTGRCNCYVKFGVTEACYRSFIFFFFQAEDGIRDLTVTGVQTCALPISSPSKRAPVISWMNSSVATVPRKLPPPKRITIRRRPAWKNSSAATGAKTWTRSEEHTSELQSQSNLVCRLLLEKKNIYDTCRFR